MQVITGTTIAGGVAIGPLRVCRRAQAPAGAPSALTPAGEWARFEAARRTAQAQLAQLYQKALDQVGAENAAIFEIHQMLLDDEDYLDAVKQLLDTQNVTAEAAAAAAGENFAALFAAMEDAYMRARAADIRDISGRVVDVLTGRGEERQLGEEPVILVADDLTPSETIQLDRSKLLGFVTRQGSANSHTAILARTMNIPALTGVVFDESWNGRTAILDGNHGRLYLDPTRELQAAMEESRRAELEQRALLQSMRGKPDVTLDGRTVRLYANIGGPGDAELALQNDARGVGLFRTEFLYLEAEDYPGEERQFAVYQQVVEAMAGKRVIIRTLDIGADKQAAYFNLEQEENPALGCRAIRICLTRRDIFRQQLRAILRAAAFGTVGIMFPMITSVWEVREAKELLEACRAELRTQGAAVGELEIGVMIETPAAVVIADELAEEVDFFSLGTNDLTQYTLAVDRQNPKLSRFYDPHHPAVLRMIRHTVEAGHRHGCWVGICGELGADQSLTEEFLRMGVDELSVSPAAVLPLRRHIRSLNLSKGTRNG